MTVIVILGGCGKRLDLPQEPEESGNPGGQVAYVKKYAWDGMPAIADLVLTRGQALYGIADSTEVQSWFSDTSVPRRNPTRDIRVAVVQGDTLRTPVQMCEGPGNTLWVAYRRPQPTLVQWDIAVVPPAPVDSGLVRDATIGAFGGIAADRDSGYVYVADHDKSTIKKYAPSAGGGRRVVVLATEGAGDFTVKQPNGLFFFHDSLLVAEAGVDKNWLQVLHADVPGRGRGQVAEDLPLNAPTDVWVDASGFYYVADTGGGRVLKLTPSGQIKEIVTEFDPEAARLPTTIAATQQAVWVVDPERNRLTIYQINTTGEELP